MSNLLRLFALAFLNAILLTTPLLLLGIRPAQLASNDPFKLTLVMLSIWFIAESHQSNLAVVKNTDQTRSRWIPYITGPTLYILFVIAMYEHLASDHPPITWITIAALLAILAGATLRVVAIRTLGRYFTSHIELTSQHRLITSGIYSLLRHPSETGLLLICFGVCAVFLSVYATAIAVFVMLPLCFLRIVHEDKLLQSAFDSEFIDYKRSTPAMIPIVGRNRSNENRRRPTH